MAKPTVAANGLSVVHAGSKGTLTSTIPDVCSIPGPNGKIPIPFMNSAEAKNLSGGTVTVKIEGSSVAVMGSMISKSSGDEAGVLGGIVSGKTTGKSITLMFSQNVLMEMRPVIRKSDLAIMNDCNTISLQGWDQGDVKGFKGKEWVSFVTMSSETLVPVSGVKLKITLPGKSAQSFVSAPGGRISVVGLDPGTCSVELDQGNEKYIDKINKDCTVSGLGTKKQHPILIDLTSDRFSSS